MIVKVSITIQTKPMSQSNGPIDGWVTPVLLLFLGVGACVVVGQVLRDRWRTAEKNR